MTLNEIREVVGRIRYKNWEFYIGEPRRGPMWLQVRFPAPDSETAEVTIQHGRKWQLSPHMTVSEIVTTALKAVLTAEEHETREQFTYRGAMVFGPHVDVETLVTISHSRDRRASL